MSHAHKRYADADATTESLLLLTKMVDHQGAAIARLQDDVTELKSGQAEIRGTVSRIESLLGKILDGQAVLVQNDMELKRRLDQKS